MSYLVGGRHASNLLVEDFFKAFGHLRHRVVQTIKCEAVRKNQSNICSKLVCIEVARVFGIRVGL